MIAGGDCCNPNEAHEKHALHYGSDQLGSMINAILVHQQLNSVGFMYICRWCAPKTESEARERISDDKLKIPK